MSDNSAETEIPWPSFVDILSAVIMMFIFLLLITIIVLTTMTIKTQIDMEGEQENRLKEIIEKTIVELVENASQETQSKIIASLQQKSPTPETAPKSEENQGTPSNNAEEIDQAKSQAKIIQDKNDPKDKNPEQLESISVALAVGKNQTIETGSDNKDLTIFFNPNEVTMTEETMKEIKELMATRANPETHDVMIETTINPNITSTLHAKEQSLTRSLNLRNVMLGEQYKAEQIGLKQVKPLAKSHSYDWLTIRFIPKTAK